MSAFLQKNGYRSRDWDRFNDQRWMRLNATNWQTSRKAEETQYRWSAGDQFYVKVGENLLSVEVVRRKYLPGGSPGYVIKINSWGIELERDEKTLIEQHEAAAQFLKAIPLQRESGHPVPQGVKHCECTSALAWHFQLVLLGLRPGPGSRYRQ